MQKTAAAQQAVDDQEQLTARDTSALTDALHKAGDQLSQAGNPPGGRSTAPSSPASSAPPADSGSAGSAGTGTVGNRPTGQPPSGQGSGSSAGNNSASTSQGRGSGTKGSATTGSDDGTFLQGQGSDQPQGADRGSSATVAEAEAAVTTDQIKLNLAGQKLDQATITSPIDGVVAGVDFTKATSESTSDKIVITGTGAMALTVDVPGTKLDAIKIGQQATVGSKSSVGTVTAIGLLPSSDSGSSDTSYPVTITVDNPAADVADGATATASITLARVSNAIRVPISAVTRNGSAGFVTVIKDGKPQRRAVKTGAVGSTMVQITSGLSAGESVLIADRSQPLPSSDSSAVGGLRRGGTGGGVIVFGEPGGRH